MTKEDKDKRELLDLLAKEPIMVILTAYVYAKNYIKYGEDITKTWTTTVQQASIIEKVKQSTWKEAYDSFKKDYRRRLKNDIIATLTEIKDAADNITPTLYNCASFSEGIKAYDKLIQDKIDELEKSESENP